MQQQVVALLSGTKTLGEVAGEEDAAEAEAQAAEEAQAETPGGDAAESETA